MSQLAGAQTPAPTREDSLKGKLWTATARRIWADTKPPQVAPAPWPTLQAFEAWITATPTDKSELGLLRGDVVKSFGPATKATPAQVAQAIVAQAGRRQKSKKGRLTRLKLAELQTAFTNLTQPKMAAAVAPTPSDSAVAKAKTVAASPASVAENPTPQPEGQLAPSPTPTYTSTPLEPRYFGLSPTWAGVALLLLGALVGAGLASALRPSARHRHRHHNHPTPVDPDSTTIMNSQEYRKLQKQNQNLNTQLHRLQQQLDELKATLTGKPAAPAKAPAPANSPLAAPAPTPAPAEKLSVEELVGAAAPTPPPAATRYGPVQEMPFLEERKIVDSPLPQLALMLTVNPRQPDQASFTLNPQVDQARLIGDGLTRLQKFFDYDPPVGGRITAVAAVRPGRLQRQDNGWQVVERAKLAIS